MINYLKIIRNDGDLETKKQLLNNVMELSEQNKKTLLE